MPAIKLKNMEMRVDPPPLVDGDTACRAGAGRTTPARRPLVGDAVVHRVRQHHRRGRVEVLRQPPTTSTFAGAILGIALALALWAITLFVYAHASAADSDL